MSDLKSLRRCFAKLTYADQRTFSRAVMLMAEQSSGAEELCLRLRDWAGNPPRPCKVNPFAVSGFAFRNGLSQPKSPGAGPKTRKRRLPTSAEDRDRRPWSMGDGAKPAAGTHVGPIHKCQWIEGEPSHDESCKCLAETLPGKPYCGAHFQRSVTAHVYKRKAGEEAA